MTATSAPTLPWWVVTTNTPTAAPAAAPSFSPTYAATQLTTMLQTMLTSTPGTTPEATQLLTTQLTTLIETTLASTPEATQLLTTQLTTLIETTLASTPEATQLLTTQLTTFLQTLASTPQPTQLLTTFLQTLTSTPEPTQLLTTFLQTLASTPEPTQLLTTFLQTVASTPGVTQLTTTQLTTFLETLASTPGATQLTTTQLTTLLETLISTPETTQLTSTQLTTFLQTTVQNITATVTGAIEDNVPTVAAAGTSYFYFAAAAVGGAALVGIAVILALRCRNNSSLKSHFDQTSHEQNREENEVNLRTTLSNTLIDHLGLKNFLCSVNEKEKSDYLTAIDNLVSQLQAQALNRSVDLFSMYNGMTKSFLNNAVGALKQYSTETVRSWCMFKSSKVTLRKFGENTEMIAHQIFEGCEAELQKSRGAEKILANTFPGINRNSFSKSCSPSENLMLRGVRYIDESSPLSSVAQSQISSLHTMSTYSREESARSESYAIDVASSPRSPRS